MNSINYLKYKITDFLDKNVNINQMDFKEITNYSPNAFAFFLLW